MKKVNILVASLLASTIGFSQVSLDPEVGVNFSNIRTKVGDNDATTTDSKTGFKAGVGVNIDLYKGLYLRPGIYYNQLGGKTELLGTTTSSTLHYLEIPVNIGYRYELSPKAGNVFAEVGPYAGIALSGKVKTEIGSVETKKDIDFGDEIGETKPMDFGFKFGIGYETPWGIYVKGNYGLGVANLSNADNVTSTNNAWNISLGYRIKF